jgi:hypothetical protein
MEYILYLSISETIQNHTLNSSLNTVLMYILYVGNEIDCNDIYLFSIYFMTACMLSISLYGRKNLILSINYMIIIYYISWHQKMPGEKLLFQQ